MNILLIIPILIGWLAGACINYLADVLPITRSFKSPVIDGKAQFIITDYLFLRKKTIRVFITQFVIVLISLFTWLQPPQKLGYWLGILLLIYLVVVFVIDMEHRLILHPTSIFGSLLTFGLGTFAHGFLTTLLGGLAGFLILLAFYYFGVLFTRLRAKRLSKQGLEADDEEALGAGDVILATVLGFLVGWPLIWFSILMSILLGGIFSFLLVLWLIVSGRYSKDALMVFIPYGPYFIISAFLIIYLPAVIQFFLPN